MHRFRDRPIRQKVLALAMVTTTVALLAAGLGFVAADSFLYRRQMQDDLRVLARIVANNSTAALAFDDPDAATQTLRALRFRKHVDAACVYRVNGTILAKFPPEAACPPPAAAEVNQFGGGGLTVSQPIILRDRRIGTLALFYDLGEISERIRLYGSTVAGVILAASLLAFLLSSRLRAAVVTPISRLVDATTSVADTGDYGIRAVKLSGDELGILVDRFNEMLTGIQSRDDALKKALAGREAALREVEQERERFHFMAESMPQKIFAAGLHGESLYLNQQWTEFSGLPLERLRNWGWLEFIHPDDRRESLRVWQHSIATGEPLQLTNRFRRADGAYRWHLNRARAMRNAQGEIVLWIGSSTEIHEQKEKEEELRRANEDLQQFAYSASHDLQEPIRNVAVYSELVARRYQHLLDADGQLYLQFLREGGLRTATLINDLLAYTRASTAELSQAPVNAAMALRNALVCLAEAIRESEAQVTYDALPEVHIGEAHLQQVFQNLISNALKYRNNQPPRVHVSAASRGAFWRFSVQDNGIGIDPQYKEKIFGVFKRLHHDQQYGGTGIGLAICQRVVERYGGRIWVESEPGNGATFYFTVQQRGEGVASPVEPSSG